MADISTLPPPPPGYAEKGKQLPSPHTPNVSNTQTASGIESLPPPPPAPGIRAATPAPASIVGLPPPPPVTGEEPEYQALRSEMDRGIGESLRDTRVVGSESISDQDREAIARKHGVSAEELRSVQPFLGGETEWADVRASDIPKSAAGGIGQLAFGVPQKIYKKFQSPQMEAALDDLQELAQRRASWVQFGGQLAGPGSAIRQGTTVGSKALAGAVTGAIAGGAGSRKGEELSGAAVGAGLGGGLGALAGKLSSRQASPIERKMAAEITTDLTPVAQIVEKNKQADDALARNIFDPSDMTDDEARAITDTYVGNVPEYLDSGTVPGKVIRDRLGRGADEPAIRRELARSHVESRARDLVEDLGEGRIPAGQSPFQTLAEKAGRERSGAGDQYVRERLRDILDLDATRKYIDDKALQDTKPTGFLGKVGNFLSDAQYVLRAADEKARGIGIEDAHKELNRNYNRMTYPREKLRGEINAAYKLAKREGVDNLLADGGELIRKVEAGEALTAAEQKAYQPVAEFFQRNLDTMNQLAEQEGVPPLRIASREGYIPSQLVDTHTLQERVTNRVQQLLDEAGQLTERKYERIADVPEQVLTQLRSNSPDSDETIRFVHSMSGTDSMRPADLQRAYQDTFLTRDGRVKLEAEARAAQVRNDALPMWARETNVYKLMDKWTNNTLRGMYLRRPIDKLRNAAEKLRSLGMDTESQYIRDLLSDVQGIRKGTAAEYFNNVQGTYLRKMDKLIEKNENNPIRRSGLIAAKALPTMLQQLAREVYPNMLGGLNPRTLIMNLTQPITKSLPELGPGYGSLLALRGAARIGGVRKLPQYVRRMEQMGFAPSQFIGGNLDYLAEGIMRSGAVQLPQAALRAVAEVGIKPYQWAEQANRGITFAMSEMMSGDLLRGSSVARDALGRFPTSVQRSASAAIAAGDEALLTRIIANHMINNTQYQYNRASMSQYGRTFGPLFSTFSKWPTATLGQAIEEYRKSGALRGTQRLGETLVGPWLMLEAADTLMGQHSEDGFSDRQQKLLSKQGFSQAAPIGNLAGIASGDFFTPPVIDTALAGLRGAKQAGQALLSGEMPDSEELIRPLQKTIANSIYQFAPGGLGGWTRFITDDAVTLMTGERPGGSDFGERTQSGIDELSR